MTSLLDAEREAQKVWQPRYPRERALIMEVMEKLLLREYLEPERARELEARELARILRFARQQVPYYRSLEEWTVFDPEKPSVDRELLSQLPILSKLDVIDHFESLRAERLSRGQVVGGSASSSGTSGRRTRVLFSKFATMMFTFNLQRHMRWARVDPSWTQAAIRLPENLPTKAGGKRLPDGVSCRVPRWMYFDRYFDTGPYIGLGRGTPIERQIEWLKRERPQYLLTFPNCLEALVSTCQGTPVDSLLAQRTISATLTPGMRRRIESATGIPVLENYGLNEIGIVASRCEAGRNHVNAEHCVVEIVDADGVPCPPGESGRVLVTALTNFAMPLVRYDTGDVAQAVSGPCPCGRTLPTFGRVFGRYRPMKYTPAGTTERRDLVFETMDRLPLEAIAGLREFQLHQYRDGRFELRLVTRNQPGAELVGAVQEAWDSRYADSTPLSIRRLESLPSGLAGKIQDFTSDFFPSVLDE